MCQGHGVYGTHRGNGVALDAGDLDEPADRVAGEAQHVLHRNLRGVFDLGEAHAAHLCQRRRRHAAGRADLRLAAAFGAGDRSVCLNDIPDVEMIYAGQVLKLPDENFDISRLYTVQPDDTLWKIANKFDIPVAELINLNRLRRPDSLYPGQTLRIN